MIQREYIVSPWAYVGTIRMNEIREILATPPVKREKTKRRSEQIPIRVMVENLFEILQNHYGIPIAQLKGRKRSAEIVYVRQLFCYWLRSYYGNQITWKKLGEYLGKDHTSTMYSVDKYKNRLSTNQFIPDRLGMPGITSKMDYIVINSKIENLCL